MTTDDPVPPALGSPADSDDPTASELCEDFPEGGLPDPVVAPTHELTRHLMSLSSAVAEHGVKLSTLSNTSKEHLRRLLELEKLSAAVAGLLDRVAELEPPSPDPEASTEEHPDPEQRVTPSGGPGVGEFDPRVLIGWVRENVSRVLEREIPASRSPNWCRQWWLHAEAILRLEAVRRCWLDANTENAGLGTYFQHLDYQLGVLMSEGGPFAGCKDGEHTTEPASARWLGQDEPDESFYTEFTRLRTATVVAATSTTPPAGAHAAGPDPTRGPVTDAPFTGGGVVAPDLAHRRNGRSR